MNITHLHPDLTSHAGHYPCVTCPDIPDLLAEYTYRDNIHESIVLDQVIGPVGSRYRRPTF